MSADSDKAGPQAPGESGDPAVLAAANQALVWVQDGMSVGLGSGRASRAFIRLLGGRVREEGWKIKGVPTSEESGRLAKEFGIPLIDLDETTILDLTVDGADEVGPGNDLIKGWGNALVRERIVASASKRQVILVGPEKIVPAIGARGKIPIEIIPLSRGPVVRKLKALGLSSQVRLANGVPRLTDNGNLTLDCAPPHTLDPQQARAMEAALLAIAGVVDTGLFLGTAAAVIVGYPDGRVDIVKT